MGTPSSTNSTMGLICRFVGRIEQLKQTGNTKEKFTRNSLVDAGRYVYSCKITSIYIYIYI